MTYHLMDIQRNKQMNETTNILKSITSVSQKRKEMDKFLDNLDECDAQEIQKRIKQLQLINMTGEVYDVAYYPERLIFLLNRASDRIGKTPKQVTKIVECLEKYYDADGIIRISNPDDAAKVIWKALCKQMNFI